MASGDALFSALAGDFAALFRRVDRARGVAARRYALSLLETALVWADPGTVDAAHRERARSLGITDAIALFSERSAPLHAVRIPLVDPRAGRGLVRTFFASFDAAPGAGAALDPGSEHALREAFDLAAQRAEGPRVRPIRWVAAMPRALDGIELSGESMGGGALVSAYALLTGRTVRPQLAISTTLKAGLVGPVANTEPKIAAARAAGVQRLILPGAGATRRSGALEIVHVETIDALLAAALESSAEQVDVRALVLRAHDQARRGWRGFRWPEARELLERAFAFVPDGELDTRVDLLARLGAAERHAGSLTRSEALLLQACSLTESDEGRTAVPDEHRSRAHQQLAMTELRLAKARDAQRAASRGLSFAVRARSRREQIKALGVVGLVAEARGALLPAIDAFRRALALDLVQSPDEVARSRAYLAEALARAKLFAEARATYDAALAEADRRRSRSDEAWVRTAYGGGLLAAGRADLALSVLDVPVIADAIARDPLPGLNARRHLGRALLVAPKARPDRGVALLESALDAHGPLLEPSLARIAALCPLTLAMLHPEDAPGLPKRAALALQRFTEGPLGDAAARVLEARGARQRARLARFLAAAERVA